MDAEKIIKELDLDFCNKNVKVVDAKQYDTLRYILVTCYNQGNKFVLNSDTNYVFVRYMKADENAVFNKCIITDDGKVLVLLSEQMLAAPGNCIADLVITDNQGSIENLGKNIISTMKFCVNVISSPIDNSDLESSTEFSALNEFLDKVSKDYKYIIDTTKGYMDNAKTSEENAKESETNSKESETNAKTSEENAKESETNSKESETNAKTSEENAKESETNSKESETNAKTSEENAKESETNSKESETNAKTSEENAKESETNSKESETNASNSALESKSYAIGTDNVFRENDSTDNSKFYKELAEQLAKKAQELLEESQKILTMVLNGGLTPAGTILFENLPSNSHIGYVYTVLNDFVTDNRFIEGENLYYYSGAKVFFNSDNKWEILSGNRKLLFRGNLDELNNAIEIGLVSDDVILYIENDTEYESEVFTEIENENNTE